MNLTETVRFLAACRAGNPSWAPVDGTANVWQAVLVDVPYDAAERALIQCLRAGDAKGGAWWPNPGDIVKHTVEQRRLRPSDRTVREALQLTSAPLVPAPPGLLEQARRTFREIPAESHTARAVPRLGRTLDAAGHTQLAAARAELAGRTPTPMPAEETA